MIKLLKLTGYILAGLITLLIVSVIVLTLIPDTQYKNWIISATQSATGRDFSIETLEFDFGRTFRIRADKVRMANADWAKQQDMLQIERLEADIDLLALLTGKADIRAVVKHAEVLAEKNAEGVSNWAMGTGKAEKEATDDSDFEFSGLPLQPLMIDIRIEDFKITRVEKPGATANVAHLKQFLIETPEKDTMLSLSADVDGHPVELSGNLGNMQQFLDKASEPMQIKGDIAGNIVNLSGNWGPLYPQQTMLIDLELKIPASASLAEFVGLKIEEFAPIEVTAKLVGDGKSLSLDPISINLDDPTAELKIRGSIADLTSLSGIKMTTDGNTQSLENLLKQLHINVPFALPPDITLSAQINGSLKDLAVSELVIDARDKGLDLNATASIGDLLKAKEIDVKLSANIDSLSSLSRYAQTELPQTDPIKINGTLTEDASKEQNRYILHAETGGANVELNGVLAKLAVPEKFDADISIKAASLTDFNKLAQSELPDQGPLDMSAKLQLHKKEIAVNDLKVSLKDQNAQGNLALKLPESDAQPTIINGKLDISFLDLTFLVPEVKEIPVEANAPVAEAKSDGGDATAAQSKASTTEVAKTEDAKTKAVTSGDDNSATQVASERLFSDKPILYEKLHDYNIDFAVNAKEIKFAKTELNDAQLVVRLKDGLLTIDPIKGAGGAGNINGVFRIDGQGEVPVMNVDIGILEVPMPNLGGKIHLDADLVGKGRSVAEMMGSLNGKMLVVMRDGKIEGPLIKKFGSGLLSFAKEKGYTELECGALRVDVKDGIANFDKRLAAQLTEVTWRGGGEINLKTEELGIIITPKPRKGIPLSIGGELSSLMYIGGTLKHPRMQLNPKDVAVKYAKYSAYVATGGLSYLAEVIKDKIDANRDVCELILEGTVFEVMDKEDEKAEKKAKKAKKKAEKEEKEKNDK